MGAASSSEACAEDPLRTEPVPGVTAWCSRSDEATPSSSGTSGRTCPSLQLSEQPTTCSAGGTSVRGTASLDTRCAERPFERSGELKEKGLLIDVEEVVLEKEICSTFTSKIYVARWHERLVAAKEVKLDSTMEGLMHEVQILSKINHPSLLQLVGASLDISSPMMLTELMLKQDVETYMLQQSLRCLNGFWRPSFCLALHWAASTAQGLAYLHERDLPIVHRDLMPGEKFGDLEVKLGDFGLAMEMSLGVKWGADLLINLPLPWTFIAGHWSLCLSDLQRFRPRGTKLPGKMGLQGTWRYMAPEVARKEDFDEKVDIYAFSLILYYIFSGRQPFHTFQDPRKVVRAYRAGQQTRPFLAPELVRTKELRQLLLDAWHAAPSARPTALECVERLSRLQAPSLTLGQVDTWAPGRPFHDVGRMVVAARRTAVGKFGGSLAGTSAVQLGAQVIQQLLQDTGGKVSHGMVDEVIIGQVLTAGTCPALTINKVCGSGLKALHLAMQAIVAGGKV
eukprot:g22337.t2